MARRFLLLWVAAAALFLNLVGPAQAAEPTALTASAEAQEGGISVVGTMTSNGAPVANATIDVAVDSTPTTTATTDDAGAFRATVPVADLTVAHTLQLSFAGTADLTATTIDVAFTPIPVETRTATTLSASVADDTLYPGELITITGSLEAAGAPVPASEIDVYLSGEEQADSMTFTNDAGRFTTYAEVPPDLAAGDTALRVAHPGNRSTLPSEQGVTLTIQQAAPEPTDDATAPSEEATPTQDETTPATQPPTTEAAASPDPTATSEVDAETTATAPSPFNWFWVGIVVVGGSAALVTIALLMSRAASREERRERSEGVEPLYLLADDEDVQYLPEDHGWVTEEFFMDDDGNHTDPGADQGNPARGAEPQAEPAGETTQPFPAPRDPGGRAVEPEPEIYRGGDEPLEQPKPRRSWSGEE